MLYERYVRTVKKYNIAIIGTFDYENFGDLMFPIVFKKQIEQRLNLGELLLFSPNSCDMPQNPEKLSVISIDRLEELHNNIGIDAIVFGGGELARLDNGFAPSENYIPTNTSFDMMIYSAAVANKYSIPMLWNCPGVPFEFSPSDKILLKTTLDDFIDYISVRDSRSAELLRECKSNKDIKVSPDTVLSISKLIDKNYNGIFDRLSQELPFLKNRYIVFQSMVSNSEDYIAGIINQLEIAAEKSESKVLFFPIGNVHGDNVFLERLIKANSNDSFLMIDRKLDIFEMNAVLANAYCFIGTSLHGNIVSNSYGVPSIGIDLLGLVKLRNYFRLVEREEYCLSDVSEVSETFAKMLESDTMSGVYEAIRQVDDHFDNIAKIIVEHKTSKAGIKQVLDACHNHKQLCCNNVSVYFDFGSGFVESKDFKYSFFGHSQDVCFSIKIPENAKAIRIDLTDNSGGVVKNVRIISNDKKLKYKTNCSFTDNRKNTMLFLNADSQIWAALKPETKSVEVSFSIVTVSGEDIEAFYSEICPMLLEAENTMKKQKKEIKELGVKINKLNSELSMLSVAHNQVLNSFYWRITALPRRCTHKLKMFIKRKKVLRFMAVAVKTLLFEGPGSVKKKINHHLNISETHNSISYKISEGRRKEEAQVKFKRDIKISVLVPLYNTPEKYLKQMIESVKGQTYSNWELCLADGSTEDFSSVGRICEGYAKADSRIRYKKLEKNLGISGNTNACLELATGEYIGLFDHDDLLHPSALYEVMQAICGQDADFIYTDEVTFIGEDTQNISVYNFKPDYSPDTLRSYNYICHFTVFARKLMESAGGGFNSRFDGSQDYDLILRLTEKAERIVHIPKALYFWRSHSESTASSISAKPYIVESAHKALSEHLKRVGLKGEVKDGIVPSVYKIEYAIIGEPLISIIIPNKDHISDLDKCISAIFDISSYRNFEIIIAENNSTEPETFEYYEKLKAYDNIKVVYWQEGFNYSAINNFAAGYAEGEYLLFLNNDIETITENWLEELLMFAQRSDVGAVGAKLYYPDDTVQHAGVIIGIRGVAGHSHKYYDRNDPGFMTRAGIAQNLSACTAACLMVPKRVFDEVGGLDEGFAVAFNDIDFCMKIRKAGYLIVFTPYAELYHYESKSRGSEDTPEKVARFNSEIDRFKSRWGDILEKGDPYYNPNLTLDYENFGLK